MHFARTVFLTPLLSMAPQASSAAQDLALGCKVSASQLKVWQPTAHVPGALKRKFLKLGEFDKAGPNGAASKVCKGLPPAVAIVPGPNKGGIVRGDILIAQEDVLVHRGYAKGLFPCSIATPASQFGGWWSVEPLGTDRAGYRESVGICPSWNDLTMRVSCILKQGTAVIIGATESASCAPGPNQCSKAPASILDAAAQNLGPSGLHQYAVARPLEVPGRLQTDSLVKAQYL